MIELAQLQDGQLVYGLYEEVEAYIYEKEDTCVEHYFDHVAPFVVQKNFTYVGKQLGDPYSVSVPWNYEKGVAILKSYYEKEKW